MTLLSYQRLPKAPALARATAGAAKRRFICTAILSLCSAIHAGVASQQVGHNDAADPGMQLRQSEAMIFRGALEALSSRGHIAIVAEGVPVHPSPSKTEMPVLPASLPLSSAVERVAAAYDYQAERHGNTFVLEKRYTNSSELPAVSPDECLQALQNITRLAGPFNPHIEFKPWAKDKRNEVVGDLAVSLTPAQLKAMGNQSLHVADLDTGQQEMVRRFALYHYIQSQGLDIVENGLSLLQNAKEQVVFRRSQLGSYQHIFGYTVPEGPRKIPRFYPLSGPFSNQTILSGIVMVPPAQNGAPPQDPTDPVHKGDNDTPPATLESVAQELNAGPKTPIHLTVDASLRQKPVTVVGAENVPSMEIAAALATVYGLRLVNQNGGNNLQLTLPPPIPAPPDIAALPEAIRSSIPLPLLHALHVQEFLELQARIEEYDRLSYGLRQPAQVGGDQSVAEQREAMRARKDLVYGGEAWKQYPELSRRWRRGENTRTMRITAIRELRATAEPRVDASPTEEIAFPDLNEVGKEAFSLTTMLDCLTSLSRVLGHNAPEYLVHFNKAVLGGGISTERDGTQRFRLSLMLPESEQLGHYESISTDIRFVR